MVGLLLVLVSPGSEWFVHTGGCCRTCVLVGWSRPDRSLSASTSLAREYTEELWVAVTDSIEVTLTPLNDAIRLCDPSGLDACGLRSAAAAVRELQRSVEALLLRVARRSNELAAEGAGSGARELMVGTGQVSARRARSDATRAEVTAALPEVLVAVDEGRIGSEHVDVIATATRGLDEVQQAAVAEQETLIVDAAASQPVDVFNTWLKRRINVIREDWGRQEGEEQRAASEFRHWRGHDGMGHFRGKLDPQRFDTLVNAIDRHVRSIANHSADSVEVANGLAQKRQLDANLTAEALVELVSGGNGRHGRAEIKLVVDAHTLLGGAHEHTVSETSSGTPVPPETVDRYACAADIQRVAINPDTMEINVGRKYRTATDAQWSALVALYATCGWYGCDRPIDWCQAHHVTTWEALGDTDLDNLLPLCNQHHHATHEGGWRIELDPDRTVRLYTPDGTHWHTTHPNRLQHWLTSRQTPNSPSPTGHGAAADDPATEAISGRGTSPPIERPRSTS